MELVTSAQMREIDQMAIRDFGIPSILLMENAGIAAFEVAKQLLECACEPRVLVMCGSGNNGGDGYVVARHLSLAGVAVNVAHCGEKDAVKGDAKTNMDIAARMRIPICYNPTASELQVLLRGADLIVDALLGTGSRGEARGLFVDFIRVANASYAPILSLDIPSGINPDNGEIPGICIQASRTISFGLPKIGLYCNPAAQVAGELANAPIGIPQSLLMNSEHAGLALDKEFVRSALPARPSDSHKGSFGHLAVLAGSVGMAGAAVLSGLGAMRVGTGLLSLFVPESINPIVQSRFIEAMSVPLPDNQTGLHLAENVDSILQKLQGKDALLIGPGIGRDPDTVKLVLELVSRVETPLVLDADALYAVAGDLQVLKNSKAKIVLTPHPGEMALLLGTTAADVQAHRLELARTFTETHGVTLVLKGHRTVITSVDMDDMFNTSGCSGMSTAGSGDVLAGMIAGYLVQGQRSALATALAVYLHGRAGEMARDRFGNEAMLAGDIADNIGSAIEWVRADPAADIW